MEDTGRAEESRKGQVANSLTVVIMKGLTFIADGDLPADFERERSMRNSLNK